MYLRESTLGHSVIDSLGKRSCIRRVPIRSDWGQVEFDELQHGAKDWIDVSGLSFRHLPLRLTNDVGTVIPLEAPLNFALWFSSQDS